MRCKACNKALTDFESTRKSSVTEEFLDLCNTCYKHIKEDTQVIERPDLMEFQDYIDNEDFL